MASIGGLGFCRRKRAG
ncbi:MprA protease, GlyGly-CTERM protein-sorting domain-containing form [Undibacterium arcticum]|uniref:MprA protease, GlyGly-CTERM protein-sorting domain-containing form n=1 Tax=Undibacterium arcticum TaxID=1762892 RepID=A0ABV7F8W6_9BURK